MELLCAASKPCSLPMNAGPGAACCGAGPQPSPPWDSCVSSQQWKHQLNTAGERMWARQVVLNSTLANAQKLTLSFSSGGNINCAPLKMYIPLLLPQVRINWLNKVSCKEKRGEEKNQCCSYFSTIGMEWQQHTGCLEHSTGEPPWCLFPGLNSRPIPLFSLQTPDATKGPIAAATECQCLLPSLQALCCPCTGKQGTLLAGAQGRAGSAQSPGTPGTFLQVWLSSLITAWEHCANSRGVHGVHVG